MEEAENQSEYWMEEEHLDTEKSDSYEAEADRLYQEVYKMHNQVADFIVSLTSGQIDKVTAMLMMRQRRSDVERILEMAQEDNRYDEIRVYRENRVLAD